MLLLLVKANSTRRTPTRKKYSMKKAFLFFLLISLVSICIAESPDVSSGKGTVIPSRIDVTDATFSKDMGTSNKDEDSVQRETTTSIPKTISVQNNQLSMSQSDAELAAQETNTTMESLRAAFPSLTNFISFGTVEKGSKLKIPSGAKYFIALVNGKWVSYELAEGAEQFTVPESAPQSYFAW